MKQTELIPKESLCQNGCLVLVRIILTHVVLVQGLLSFIPSNQLTAIAVYLTGLITCQDISATGISLALSMVSHDGLTRMLNTPWWTAQNFMMAAVKLVTLVGGEGWLIIDDTLIPKIYSKVISFCYWDWDHAQKRNILGIRLVFVVWCNGFITLPLGFYIWQKSTEVKPKKGKKTKKPRSPGRKKKPGRKITSNTASARYQRQHRKELKKKTKKKRARTSMNEIYRTKNELARGLVWQLVRSGIKVRFILLDNWYASKKNIRFFERLELFWVTKLKSNQKVVYQGRKMTIEQVAKSVPKQNYHYYDKLVARARSFEVKLYGKPIKLTVVKNDTHDELGRTKYLATNDLDLSNCEHVIWYRRRWPIELFFRDAKQFLGLGRSCVRDPQSVVTHIVMVCMAYVITQLFKPLSLIPHLSMSLSKNALCSLRLLVNTVHGACTLVWLKPRGRFVPVDLELLFKPVRTRISQFQIPESIENMQNFIFKDPFA